MLTNLEGANDFVLTFKAKLADPKGSWGRGSTLSNYII